MHIAKGLEGSWCYGHFQTHAIGTILNDTYAQKRIETIAGIYAIAAYCIHALLLLAVVLVSCLVCELSFL